MDDGGVEAGLHALVEEHRVEDVADGRLQTEAHVGHAEHGGHAGQLRLDAADGLHRLDGVPAEVLLACAEREGQGIKDQVAGLKAHGRSDVAEQFGDGKDQVASGCLLFHCSVQPRDDGDGRTPCGVDLVGDDRADRAEGIETFAAGPLAVRLLNVPRGDVVDADVAANVGAHVFVWTYFAASAGDDDAEFSLVINARGDGRQANDAPGSE